MNEKLEPTDSPIRYLKIKKFLLTATDPRTNTIVTHSQECLMRADSVAVLVYRPMDKKFIWVEQYRIGPGTKEPERPTTVEPVAGMIENNNTPIETARREVEEEAGLKLATITPLHSFYMCPGVSNERMHLFFATVDQMDIAENGGLESEHEVIKIHVFSAEETQRAMDAGRMNTAHSIMLWQWAQLNGYAPIVKHAS